MSFSFSFRASDDEALQSYQVDRWGRDDSLVEYLQFMFSPHGLDYISPLNSLFLYKLKNFQQLNYFKTVFVRDGALLLFKFFIQNPQPQRVKTQLIISEKLSLFVPESWRSQVFFYRPYTTIKPTHGPVLLHGLLDEFSICEDKFDQKISHLKQLYPRSQILGLFNFRYPESQEDLWKSNHFHLNTCKKILKAFPDLKFINWNEAQKLPAANLTLSQISDDDFWYSDSYTTHFFLQKGASLDLGKSLQHNYDTLEKIEMSCFHGIEIHKYQSDKNLDLSQKIFGQFQETRQLVFQEEDSYPKLASHSRFIQPTSLELMSFTRKALEQSIE